MDEPVALTDSDIEKYDKEQQSQILSDSDMDMLAPKVLTDADIGEFDNRVIPEISKAPEWKIFDKVKNFFGEKPEREIATAHNIYALSEVTGLSLKDVANNYDLLRQNSKVTGITPDLERQEYTTMVMLYTLATGFPGAFASPIDMAKSMAKRLIVYAALDKIVPTREWIAKAKVGEETKTVLELADLITKGLIVRGIFRRAPKMVENFTKQKIVEYKLPREITLTGEQVRNIYQSGELTTAEQKSLYVGLGLTGRDLRASLEQGVTIKIPAEKVINIVDKPFWGKIKGIFGTMPIQEKVSIPAEKPTKAPVGLLETKPTIPQLAVVTKPEITAFQDLITKVKSLQPEKELSNITVSRIKKFIGIENIKQLQKELKGKYSIQPQVQKLIDYLDKFEKGDKLLSEKQLEGLKDIIKELPEPEITPKRIVIDQFGDKEEILPVGITGRIMNELMPTVDIKEGHPLIEGIVNKADELLTFAGQEVNRRNIQLNLMLTKAEKSRQLKLGEKIKRLIAPQNREILEALSGKGIDLTKEEVAVVAYLKNFFKMVRKDLQLEKYRKHYVTHLEQPLMEKIVSKGFFKAIDDFFKKEKPSDIPINLMLELDNIIGSEKFFKFALERKGGIKPTTNIRRIIHAYSNLYETKKALDQILPEGQAITKLLLQNRSAMWMKRYLQNLKGRGLDQNFRTGKMAWVARLADGIVDLGYIKLLGLPRGIWSGLKNLVAGEANAIIVQDFHKYLIGKQRFFSNPKKAIEMANKYGVLEGTFAEYAQKGIGKFKKIQDLLLIQQRAGEYEIRGSMFMAELTDREFITGEISQEKLHKINDLIAISQGRFTKTETPLILQTWYGRMFMQMNRWRITNFMLTNRLIKGTIKELKAGKKNGKNTQGLAKAFLFYGIGMYLYWELAKAGYERISKIVKSMAETLNNMVEIVTGKVIVDTLTDNPTYSLLKEFFFTIQNLANYIAPALVEEPQRMEFQKGIEETYIAPKKGIEEIIETIGEF
jgi:hypothetical protein